MSDPVEVPDGPRVLREALVRFATYSVLTLVAVSLGIFLVAHHVAKSRALEEARDRTYRLSNLVIAPLVDRQFRAHRPTAMKPLVQLLTTRLEEGTMRHIKLWAADGTVIWSDETAVVGRRFELPPDVASLFGTEDVTAEVSTLTKAENVYEQDEGTLLEVYAGTYDADEVPMVFEAYLTTTQISADERAIVGGTLPIAIGALLVMQLAVLPLAVSLARRVQRSEAARSRMTTHALRAAELEQRRIARDLHDGVVQDLAGVGFTLPGIRRQLPDTAGGRKAASALDRVRGIVQQDVAALRSMMIDVYPPDLAHTGLGPPVVDLASRGGDHGVEVSVRMNPGPDVPLTVSRLAYRVVREGLHNVYKHSGATAAQVRVERAPARDRRDGEVLVVGIHDDGRGVAAEAGTVQEGHLGLRLLEEAVADVGGTLLLTSVRDGSRTGSLLEARLPMGRH